MRRQVTVGGLVALALLSGSVVAYAAQPAPPGECAPAAAAGREESAGPGLVPAPRAAGQDDPDDDPSDDDQADDAGDDAADPGDDQPDDAGDDTDDGAGEDPGEDADPGDDQADSGDPSDDEEPDDEEPDDDPADDDPADDDPADDDPADEDPADEDPADEDPADEDPADDDQADDAADDDQGDDAAGDDAAGDDPTGDDQPADASDGGEGDGSGAEEPPAGAGDPATGAPAAEPAADPSPSDAAGTTPGDGAAVADPCAGPTAAEALGWGAPSAADGFDGPLGGEWRVYSGTGFDGQGTRTADALTVDDGILTITGDPAGATGGMAWATGQEYGRWEARVRTPAGDPSYNALLLLWPDDPAAAGREIDFMEMLDPARQTASAFVHPGAEAAPAMGEVAVDGTAWHTWAVEWTPTAVTTYLDGVEWWTVTDPALLPSGPMHLCVQLDWFPTGAGEVRESSMQVDWVRQYTLDTPADATGPAPADTDDPAGSDPAAAGPGTGDAAPGVPGAGAPATGGPATGGPATGGPATGGPATGDPAAGDAAGAERLTEGAPDFPARPGLVPHPVRAR